MKQVKKDKKKNTVSIQSQNLINQIFKNVALRRKLFQNLVSGFEI